MKFSRVAGVSSLRVTTQFSFSFKALGYKYFHKTFSDLLLYLLFQCQHAGELVQDTVIVGGAGILTILLCKIF